MPELPHDFPHSPPEGYKYATLQFKNNVVSIWTIRSSGFTYNGNAESHCIWGFYDTKKRKYYSPVNSKKVGKEVDLSSTTPYTAMPLNLNPLEYALYA